MARKIIIIGGVAGGATTATRLRRMDESNVITSRDALIVQTIEDMHQKFNIDIRNFTEVTAIDQTNKVVLFTNLKTGETGQESYDKLVISTGAQPIKPPISGIKEAKNLFTLRNIPDMDAIIAYIKANQPKTATVIGGGFIGIEMMENLVELGIKVTLVEMAPQVLAMFDYEMAQMIHQTITDHEVELILNDGVKSFNNAGKSITLSSGKTLETDLIIFAIGVRPDNELAKKAGLTLTPKGSIQVNEYLITSNPDIYAIGDVIEINSPITHQSMSVALAGPANKQARFVANHICGFEEVYPGGIATSAVKVFDKTCASVGANEKTLIQLQFPFKSIHLHPASHASYYPGSESMSIKVMFNPEDETIYGAQIIGGEGVDKRIDVLATAIYAKLKVTALKNLDLAYAPPFSSAKDPINMVGFIAENLMRDLVETISWSEMKELASHGHYLLDIREEPEYVLSSIPGSINIPLTVLRSRLNELPKDREIYVYCHVGTRGYTAARMLMQHGFNVKNLDGGLKSYHCVYDNDGSEICYTVSDDLGHPILKEVKPIMTTQNKIEPTVTIQVDACGMQCPGPIVQVYKTMQGLKTGDIIEIKATDPGFLKDIGAWAEKTNNTLLDVKKDDKIITAHIQKGTSNKPQDGIQVTNTYNGTTIVVFSQDLDKAIAAFIIASGAKSLGKDVSLFFTFWGLNILRKPKKVKVKKSFIEKMFGFMMPRGVNKLPISNMNMFGMGPAMIKGIMKKKNVDSLQTLMKNAMDMGVKIIACAMSMDIMGIKQAELIDGIEVAGVATYLADTQDSNHNLFI